MTTDEGTDTGQESLTQARGRLPRDARGDEVEAVALLIALRHPGTREYEVARARLAAAPAPTERLSRMALRARVVAALAESLTPNDRTVARWLLEQESADLRAERRGATEGLYTLVAALARFAAPEDALVLWRAREATPETRAGVDVEQLGRAGVAAVRGWLMQASERGVAGAAEALAWLEEGATAGAFDDLPEYFAWSDERFGLHATAPT